MEAHVGIISFANDAAGFSGIHKQKYSDFVVREVSCDGHISRLVDTNGAKLEELHFPTEQKDLGGEKDDGAHNVLVLLESLRTLLMDSSNSAESLTGETGLGELQHYLEQCVEDASTCPPDLTSSISCSDKQTRTSLHQLFRTHISKFVETDTFQDGISRIRIMAKRTMKKGGENSKKRRFQSWPSETGDYLRFTLLKENIDTINAANILCKNLHVKNGGIAFAGAKDKRAVTAQKCTIYRKKPSELARINRFNNGPTIRVGDFEFVKEPMKLGDLGGNRFGIVLRALDKSLDVVQASCKALQTSGFINYFGLQRFGKGGASSHEIGRAIFKSEWKKVLELLFMPREGDKVEIAEAKAVGYAHGEGAGSTSQNKTCRHAVSLHSRISHEAQRCQSRILSIKRQSRRRSN